MSRWRRPISLSMCVTLGLPLAAGQSARLFAATAPSPEPIATNDNRTAAGTLADGALTIRLEARAGEWHPDGDTNPGVVVKAFSADGGPCRYPAPLIRVTEGTEIRVIVRNTLDAQPLVMRLSSPW